MALNFKFKETSSSNFPFLIVQELPQITLPPKRIEFVEIEGMDGDILVDKGFKSYTKTIKIALKKTATNENINSIISWLTGSGDLTMSNESNMIYDASLISQINFEKLMRYKTASIEFYCQPHKTQNQFRNEDDTSITFENSGNIPSTPVVEFYLLKDTTIEVFDNFQEPSGELSLLFRAEVTDTRSYPLLVVDYKNKTVKQPLPNSDLEHPISAIEWEREPQPFVPGYHEIFTQSAEQTPEYMHSIHIERFSRWL